MEHPQQGITQEDAAAQLAKLELLHQDGFVYEVAGHFDDGTRCTDAAIGLSPEAACATLLRFREGLIVDSVRELGPARALVASLPEDPYARRIHDIITKFHSALDEFDHQFLDRPELDYELLGIELNGPLPLAA